MSARLPMIVWCLLASLQASEVHAQRLQARGPSSREICVQVRIGNDEAGRLECLNQMLRETVDRVAPVANVDDPGSNLTPVALGRATPAAVKQRYGNAYGRSVMPQRPSRAYQPPVSFTPSR